MFFKNSILKIWDLCLHGWAAILSWDYFYLNPCLLVHHCMKYLGRGIYTPQHLNGRTARFSEHQFNECSVNDFPYLALDLYLNVWDLNWYHGNCFVCSNKHFLSSYIEGNELNTNKMALWFHGEKFVSSQLSNGSLVHSLIYSLEIQLNSDELL